MLWVYPGHIKILSEKIEMVGSEPRAARSRTKNAIHSAIPYHEVNVPFHTEKLYPSFILQNLQLE